MVDIQLERFHSNKAVYAYGEPIKLSFYVRNMAEHDVFIMYDRLYKRNISDDTLEILLGEMELPDILDYFDYNPPRLRRLPPDMVVQRRVSVGMPLTESFIDSTGVFQQRDVPLSSRVRISLVVGYLKERFKAETADPWSEIVRSQELIPAPYIDVRIEDRGKVRPAQPVERVRAV